MDDGTEMNNHRYKKPNGKASALMTNGDSTLRDVAVRFGVTTEMMFVFHIQQCLKKAKEGYCQRIIDEMDRSKDRIAALNDTRG